MKRKIFCAILSLVLVLCIIPLSSLTASAAFPSLSTSRPLKVYTISTGNTTPAYGSQSTSNKIGTIYADDELWVYSISGSWAYLSYPTASGRKNAYVPLSTITSDNATHVTSIARAQVTAYRRASTSTYGSTYYVSSGDSVTKVATNGSFVQVIYPISGGYRMGWVTSTNYDAYIKPAAVASKPTSPKISINKTSCMTSETIQFTYSATNATGYTIGIDRDGIRVLTRDISAGSYSYQPTAAGKYSAYITCWNSSGYVDTPRVAFTVTQLSFNPDAVAYAYLLNDANAVPDKNLYGGPEGHNALLLVDRNGLGTYYSFGPGKDGKGATAADNMIRRSLSKSKVDELLNSGWVDGYDGKYTRSLVQSVPTSTGSGRTMYNKAEDFCKNPREFKGLTFNCTLLANQILQAGGLAYCATAIPNSAFNRLEELLGSSKVKVTR